MLKRLARCSSLQCCLLCKDGNQADTTASKLAAAVHFHQIDLQIELPTPSPLVNRALKGVACRDTQPKLRARRE